MRKGHVMFAAAVAVLGVASMAHAQLPINSPAAHWGPAAPEYTAPAPAYTAPAPSTTITTTPNANVVIEQPGVAAAPAPSAPVVAPPAGSSPGLAAGAPATVIVPEGTQAAAVPEGSTIVVMYNGVRQRVKTYADYAAVRSFDPARGILALDDGTVVNFPSNFAFLSPPEPGQPITVYYFQDVNGNNVLFSTDMGKDGGSGGGDSGGGR